MEVRMNQVRVNLVLEKDVWNTFRQIVPKREKSRVINQLLKEEIKKIAYHREQQVLASAFEEASKDTNRLTVIREWESLDVDGWEETIL